MGALDHPPEKLAASPAWGSGRPPFTISYLDTSPEDRDDNYTGWPPRWPGTGWMEGAMTASYKDVDDQYRLDWMISVDDHVLEPAHVWQDRMPARYRDAAPKVMNENGDEFWQYGGRKYPMSGLSAVAGKKSDEISPHALSFADMRPGCYEPKARLADMDEAGVIAALNFPSFPRFAGQTFMEGDDIDLGMLCLKAWNDWMLNE